ncbi:MAG: stage V sporulation protein AD [Clostridia bacterium]|nr:stage V sporulation protein AD [Clostridia bacterium]
MNGGILKTNAYILSAGTVVGKKEFDGPLGAKFDFHSEDDRFGMDTWERAEGEMQRRALSSALAKANMEDGELGAIFAGDLLNQCVSSANGLISFDTPFFGLYGACSTIAEGLMLASAIVSAGYFDTAAAVTSSHNAAAERQFRTPIEYGGQRPPTGQWTVTGSGAFILASEQYAKRRAPLARISECMPGIVIERGITDANNMGAAMAPAAESTLLRFFKESGTRPEDYDLIATGDLGYEGAAILSELMESEGYTLGKNYCDCGMMMFSRSTQDTHCGGSGCACSATVFGAHILPRIYEGELKRVIIMGTGALMSPDTVKQGDPIAGIGHLVVAEHIEEAENGCMD